jgi:hypothetical protein
MGALMELIPVDSQDILVGSPLPWALYGKNRALLVGEGSVITSDAQVASLVRHGIFRKSSAAESGIQPVEVPPAPEEVPDSAPLSFEDIRLKGGDRLQVEPPAIHGSERQLVKFIGSLKGVSVLVTTPVVGGLPMPLREGEKLVVRAFSGQNIFGFITFVERVCKIPFNYLHLSYPEQVSGKMLRKSPRIRTRIIARVQNHTAADCSNGGLAGVISDLSATGAAVDAPLPLGRKGDRVSLAFRVSLHDVETYLTLKADVRATTPHVADDGICMVRHGVEFQELESNGHVILQSLIYRQMVEGSQELV